MTLERRLGPVDAAAIVVSNVIGGSIFFVPVIVAGLVQSTWLMLAAWVAGGVLAFAGAMAYAELAALRPHAGGEYVYLRDAFGQGAAFLTGWTSFVAGFSGGIAVSAVALSGYIGRFFPAAGDQTPLLTIPIWDHAPGDHAAVDRGPRGNRRRRRPFTFADQAVSCTTCWPR